MVNVSGYTTEEWINHLESVIGFMSQSENLTPYEKISLAAYINYVKSLKE